MSLIHTLTILICLAALFSYVNHRLLGGVVDREPRPLWVLMQIKLFSLVREFSARTISILTWGVLRGGISGSVAAGWADAGGDGHHHVCGGGLLDPCAGAHDQPGVGIRRERQERG